jgi:hypothetical protein
MKVSNLEMFKAKVGELAVQSNFFFLKDRRLNYVSKSHFMKSPQKPTIGLTSPLACPVPNPYPLAVQLSFILLLITFLCKISLEQKVFKTKISGFGNISR